MKKEFWYYMEKVQGRDTDEQIKRDIVAAYIKSIPETLSDTLFSKTGEKVLWMGNWNARLSEDEKKEITREVLLKITKEYPVEEFKEYNPKAALFTIDTIKDAIEDHKATIESWILTKYKELFKKK